MPFILVLTGYILDFSILAVLLTANHAQLTFFLQATPTSSSFLLPGLPARCSRSLAVCPALSFLLLCAPTCGVFVPDPRAPDEHLCPYHLHPDGCLPLKCCETDFLCPYFQTRSPVSSFTQFSISSLSFINQPTIELNCSPASFDLTPSSQTEAGSSHQKNLPVFLPLSPHPTFLQSSSQGQRCKWAVCHSATAFPG